MPTGLPAWFDPCKLARSGERLLGTVPIDRLPRLSEALASVTGEAGVVLAARIDSDDRYLVEGHVDATLTLECQRCLAPVLIPVSVDYTLGLVASDADAACAAMPYDPLVVSPGGVRLYDLVEDELILALPLVPVHADEAECRANGLCGGAQPGRREDREARPNPFADLARLLHDSDEE